MDTPLSNPSLINPHTAGFKSLQSFSLLLGKSLPSIKILLVNDDPDLRIAFAENLCEATFVIEVATTGPEAIEKIKQQLPDVVLLNTNQKSINGFQICRLLKTDPIMTDVPIIIATEDDCEAIAKAFAAGATDFVTKPINYLSFIQHLYFILRLSQPPTEVHSHQLQLATLSALTAAQRIARIGFWTWYIKTNRFQISAHLASLCGIHLEQFDGTLAGFIQLIHPEDRHFVHDVINLAIESNSFGGIEYRLQVVNSEPISVHQELEVIIDNNELLIMTGTVQDMSRQKETEKQIRHLAYYDNLTGLASRTYYHERIDSFIKTAGRRNEQFAFLFLNLDDFKAVNEHFGHDVGDQFLNAIAQRLKFLVREIDFIARLGGDEFCIILANINDDEGVSEAANRCLQKVALPLTLSEHHQIIPKVSIGIAIFPRDGDTESELIKAADTAMFSAKKMGKHCYVFHSHDMAYQTRQRREQELFLRTAFKEEQFVLYYQPQLSINTGQIVGMEALVRWQHPELGIALPTHFIGLTDQLGLLIELGNWAIKTACEQIATWHRAGLPYIQVAVNLAPAHFQEMDLVDTVRDLLNDTGVPSQYLELEVTESAMQTNGHIEVFKQLRALGVKIAIDDFGTGFSCLASLKQLPLDCLKIDKLFIDDMLHNTHTSLLLGTIIGLANALDYTLVAEGVETQEQALALQSLGCDILQGYFFSPAMPAEDIPALVKQTGFIKPN